ncbi:MAG: 3-isopropylmalate dehydratase small subunit [Nitrosopumilus sp. B06]|nr:MAG: 3-isopropylmalate dehydratase small subunit [Nitrosopumilus sp. B06]
MKSFTAVSGGITPLGRSNVDTDQIIPKQFLKLIQRTGFGEFLFHDWRHEPDGSMRPGFILDDPAYKDSKILVTGSNFGCGSSREHAVWALCDYGFEVIVASSFADIFFSNCIKNGLLPARVGKEDALTLMQKKEARVDLISQTITAESHTIPFEIDPQAKKILLEGLDDIARTLNLEEKITRFERDSKTPSIL